MKYDVFQISYDETKPWLLKRHYAHRMPSITHAFGAFVSNEIVGVCTFGVPASPNLCVGVCGVEYKDSVLELNRVCVEDDAPFFSSWFVSRCLSIVGKNKNAIIVSYADTLMGHTGKLYQATNFIYTGATKERTDIGAEDGTHSRHYDKGCNYSENRKPRSSKHRYVYFVGRKSWRKKARSSLKYTVCEYPKGETSRYDASVEIEKQGLLL